MKNIFLKSVSMVALFFAGATFCLAQNIYTYAGTGFSGFNGNGEQATAALLAYPTDIAFDASGNSYIADNQNQVIRKVSATGIISTFAGGGFSYPSNGVAATSVILYSPTSVKVDNAGNVYVVDQEFAQVFKINSSGILTIFAGNGTTGFSGDGGPAVSATFYYPRGLAVDATGDVYVSDVENNRVRMINTSGIISTVAGNGSFGMPVSGVPATNAPLGYPVAIAIDGSGNLYIAESENGMVQKVNPAGIIWNFAGTGFTSFSGDGGPATAASLYSPEGLGVDLGGNVYISDMENSRVRVVNHNGIINTVAGNGIPTYAGDGGLAINASLAEPMGIGFDNIGNCYVVDNSSSNVRMFQSVIGPGSMCVGSTFNMTIGLTGGTWSSSNSTIASVNSSGMISAHRTGIDTLSYTYTGGQVNTVVRVDSTWAGRISGNATICYDQMDTLTPQIPGGMWTTVSGSLYFVGDGIFEPFASGLGVVQYTVNNACGSYSTLFPVNIVPLPPTGIVSGSDSICVDHTVSYVESQSGGIWGISGTGATITPTGTVTVDSVGLIVLTYTVTNMCGTQTAYYAVDVLATPDCHYINAVPTIIAQDQDFHLSPNPNNGNFVVNLVTKNEFPVSYTITNVLGETVRSLVTVTNHEQGIATDLLPGIYYVVADCSGQRFYKKIVIY